MKLLLLGLISALFATGVRAAALGEACTADDTCADTNHFCDQGLCKLKENQDCTDNTDMCITNAACPETGTKVCTCDSGYKPSTNKDSCEAVQLGEDCTDVGCVDANAVCDATDNLCRLKQNEDCTDKTDKCITNAACPTGTKICTCNSGYKANNGKDTCVAVQLGEDCSGGVGCVDTNAVCDATDSLCRLKQNEDCTDKTDKCITNAACPTDTKICTCDSGYKANNGKDTCVKTVSLGGACTSTDICATTGSLEAVCDQTGLCKLKADQDCSGDNSVNCVAGSECVTGTSGSTATCKCKGSVYTAQASGKCTSDVNEYLGSCSQSGGSDPACTGTNLECKSSVCLCTQSPVGGYVPDLSTGACVVSAKKVGATCDPANNPEAETACGNRTTTNLECPLRLPPTTCSCVSGYTGTEGGDCTKITANTVDKICSSTSDCGSSTNLVCSSKRCVCKTGYSGSKGGDCSEITEQVVGKACSKAADCGSGNNLVCSTTTSTCTCADGYYGATGAGCTAIPAQTVGRACTTATATDTDVCGDPDTTFLECVSEKCACKTGYTGSDGGTCLEIPAKRIGASCESKTAATDCGSSSTTYLTCSSGACACKTYYSGEEGGYCYKTGTESGAGNLEMSVTLLALVGLLQLFMLR